MANFVYIVQIQSFDSRDLDHLQIFYSETEAHNFWREIMIEEIARNLEEEDDTKSVEEYATDLALWTDKDLKDLFFDEMEYKLELHAWPIR